MFVPSKSYFRIGVRLTGAANAIPVVADDITFANFCPGNLFDNVAFYAGGQNVSSIVNYAPQAHAVAYRLKKSGSWLNSIGKDAYGIQSNFVTRLNKSSQDGAPAGVGDSVSNVPYDEPNQSVVYFIYQPPIGIMEYNKPLGSGDYRFQFNPAANYKRACVESDIQDMPANTYDFQVDSMELYICTEKMEVSPTGTELLHLMEHQVQSKTINGAGDLNYDFTVPPSTKAISIFVQSGLTGADTRVPPSRLSTLARDDQSLRSIQITYANITKPPTRWTSEHGGAIFKLQQRYLDTQIESTQAFSSGGCETYQQWVENGVLLHYNWARDASDRSTQLQLQLDFAQMEPGAKVFLVSHYSRSVEMSVTNGFISEIRSLSI